MFKYQLMWSQWLLPVVIDFTVIQTYTHINRCILQADRIIETAGDFIVDGMTNIIHKQTEQRTESKLYITVNSFCHHNIS